MSRLLCLVLLCSTWTIVIAGRNGFFSWSIFHSYPGKEQTLIDFSKLSLQDFEVKNGSSTQVVKYLQGPITFKETTNHILEVSYNFFEFDGNNNLKKPIVNRVDFCRFYADFIWIYMRPTLENHNDFPRSVGPRICPLAPNTYHISKVQNSKELIAPTMLVDHEYALDVTFIKDYKAVGGFAGKFRCTKV